MVKWTDHPGPCLRQGRGDGRLGSVLLWPRGSLLSVVWITNPLQEPVTFPGQVLTVQPSLQEPVTFSGQVLTVQPCNLDLLHISVRLAIQVLPH